MVSLQGFIIVFFALCLLARRAGKHWHVFIRFVEKKAADSPQILCYFVVFS